MTTDPFMEMLVRRFREHLDAYDRLLDSPQVVPWRVLGTAVHRPPMEPRWRAGDVGFQLENSYPEKYDLFLRLPGDDYFFHLVPNPDEGWVCEAERLPAGAHLEEPLHTQLHARLANLRAFFEADQEDPG